MTVNVLIKRLVIYKKTQDMSNIMGFILTMFKVYNNGIFQGIMV